MKVTKLEEGKFNDAAKSIGKKVKAKLDKAVDYWENGDEEDKAYAAQVKKEKADREADERKSSVFFASGFDMCVEKIKGFARNYKGHQIWEDIGKEFGDAAIDFALQMEEHGLFHVMPSDEAQSKLCPDHQKFNDVINRLF